MPAQKPASSRSESTGSSGIWLDAIPEAFLAVDDELRCTWLSPESERLLQVTAGRVTGSAIASLLPPPAGQTLESKCRQALEERTPLEFELFLASGQWLHGRANPAATGGVVIHWRDITPQKEAEEDLRRREFMLGRIALRAIDGLVYDWSAATGLVHRAGDVEGLTGVPLDKTEPTVEWWRSRIHPDDLAAGVDTAWQRSNSDHIETEYRIRHQSGEWRYVLDRAFLVRDESGTPIRAVGSTSDITRRKRLEAELAETARHLRLQADILSAMDDAVIVLDASRHIVYLNPGAEKFYRARLADVAGQPLTALHRYTWLKPEDETIAWKQLSETGQWKGENLHVLGDGTSIFVSSTVTMLPPQLGGGLFAVIRDVSDRKRAELEMRQHAAQLERANKDLLHFAYAVSHDLQAPLRTVINFSQLLSLRQAASLSAEGADLIAKIVSASSRMATMIRDLLEFAKVAGAEIGLKESVSLEEAMADALASLRGVIDETGAVITREPLPVVPGDVGELAQVLQNLIGNALKYRKPGQEPRVHVSVEQSPREWVLSVRDNGIGFESAQADRIFGVFQRLHGREFAGTGIGLAICKRIVERRGGRIWASAQPGEGAVFSFSLPREMAEAPPALPAAPPRATPAPVTAAAEDHPFGELFHALDLAQAIVRDLNGRILIWTNGAERLFGYTRAEAIGQIARDLIGKQFPRPYQEIEAAVLRDGEWAGQLQARKKDGETVRLASHLSLHRDGSGRPQSIVEIHNDITVFQQAELDQRFLFDLSGRTAPVTDPAELIDTAASALGGYLGGLRCSHTPLEDGAKAFGVDRFLAVSGPYGDGDGARPYSFLSLPADARAFLAVPVGERVALTLISPVARRWSAREIALMRAAAQRLEPTLETAHLLAGVREQHARFERTFELAAVGIAHVDRHGRWLRVNRRLCEITGYSRKELLATTFQDITHPDDLRADTENYERLKRGETSTYSMQKRYFHKDGHIIWVNLTVSLMPDRAGDPVAISIVEDITDRKAAEQSLKISNDVAASRLSEIEAIYESAPAGLCLIGRDLRYVRVNERLAEMSGVPASAIVGHRIGESVPNVAPLVQPVVRRVLESGEPAVNLELRGAAGPEGPRTYLSSFYPFRDSSGEIAGVNTVVLEITDRKRTEAALLQAAERLEIATSAARLGVMTWDFRQDRITWENPRMHEILGCGTQSASLSRSEFFSTFIHPGDVEGFATELAAAMDSATPFRHTCRIRRQDGTVRLVELVAEFDAGEEGKPVSLVGVVTDVTERIAAEQALRGQWQHLRNVLDALFAFVGVLTPEGVVIEANRAPLEAAGMKLEDVAGKPFAETYWWSYSAEIQQQLREAIARARQGISSRYDVPVRMQGGRMMTIDFMLVPMRGPGGEVEYLVASAIPIDERKTMELALRENERRSNLMLDSIDQLAWIARPDGHRLWYNRRWYEYTGSTEQQMLGFGWKSALDPARLAEMSRRWTASVESGERFEMEIPLRGADGVYRQFLTRAVPVHDSEGRLIQWFGTNTNIDALSKAQDVLIESERKFRELAETLPDLIWEADTSGRPIYSNPQLLAYAGFTEPGAIVDLWSGLIHPDDAARLEQQRLSAMQSGEPFRQELRARRHDGAYRWFLCRGEPLRDRSGNVVRWLGAATDIHEQKLTEEALRRSNADLEQFAYAASHDLREPLRTLSLCTQLLARQYGGAGDEAGRLTGLIRAEAGRMDGLLSGLIEYFQFAGPGPEPAAVDCNEVLAAVEQSLRTTIDESRASITYGRLPLVICAPAQLRELFAHLIGNAIKYRSAEPPRVHVSARRDGSFETISIQDNGIGIGSDYLERIFGVFRRLHKDAYPGVGVGLAICKRIVERAGGRIWVASEPGKGTTFHFTLPAVDAK